MSEEKYLKSLFDLSGKVACVTGASAGIGRTMAQSLARTGTSVVVAARREDLLAQTMDEIASQGGKSNYVVAELNDVDKIPELYEWVSEPFGPPDILVNAAGINLRENVELTVVLPQNNYTP